MAKRLQHRGGTTSQHSSFTGAVREVTVDTDKNTLVVHDGATAGGHPLATATNFTSTGIDDNATSTAVTIDSSERVGLNTTTPGAKLEINSTGSYYNTANQHQQWSYNGTPFLSLYMDAYASPYFDTDSASTWNPGATMVFKRQGSEKMRIDSSGNVGIGTSSPSQKLHVEGSAATNAIVKSTGSSTASSVGAVNNSGTEAKILMYGSTQGAFGSLGSGEMALYSNSAGMSIMNNNASGAIKFSMENGSEKMRIDSSGNVAIGTTSGNRQLTLESSGSNCGIRINNSVTGRPATISLDDSNDLTIWNNSVTGNILFYNQTGSGTERMRITSAGKVLINTTVSDNGNVTSSGEGTSGNGACYGLVRGSSKATLGLDSVGSMNIRCFTGEIYVTDSGGNTTTISPHNFSVIPDGVSEDLAWSYYARNGDVENDFDNTKYISADITKVIRKVENLTGDKLIYTGTGSTDDGSTVSQNIIQDLITRIESLEAEVTALKNQP